MYAMSNKIYQKVASLSITHIKRYFNAFWAYLVRNWTLRHLLVALSLIMGISSLILSLMAINNNQRPALIEIYCPPNFNETIEKVRGEIENLEI